jgi:hypothetical protein
VNPHPSIFRLLILLIMGFVFSASLLNANTRTEPLLGSLLFVAESVECVESKSAFEQEGAELPESEAQGEFFSSSILIAFQEERMIESTREENPRVTELHLPPPEGRC